MQQRAQALESEIQHRQELEQRLREALAGREQALAREQAARAEAEAANLLNLVRIETGRLDYSLEPIALTSIVSDVTTMVEPLLAANGLTYGADGTEAR